MYCDKCLQKQILIEEEEIKCLENEIQELQEQIQRVGSEVQNIETEKIKAQNQQIEIDVLVNQSRKKIQIKKSSNQNKQSKNKKMNYQNQRTRFWSWKRVKIVYGITQINLLENYTPYLRIIKQQIINQIKLIMSWIDQAKQKFIYLQLDILNDLFKISIQDEVGCINGLAIGRKGEQPIDWDDIAAGMGHLTLLLVYLMKKFMYQYSKIESVELNGSFTKIRVRDICQDRECIKTLNLFVQNKTSQKDEEEFSEAFVYLFQEFIQFCRYLQDGDILRKRKIHLNLPYQMQGITIQDKSISLRQQNAQKWPNWTDSVKKFLANVKALVVTNAQFDLSL